MAPTSPPWATNWKRFRISIRAGIIASKSSVPSSPAYVPRPGNLILAPSTFTYAPAERCVELKSLKVYLQRFRNQGIFYEHAVNRLLDDSWRRAGKAVPGGRSFYAPRRHYDYRDMCL